MCVCTPAHLYTCVQEPGYVWEPEENVGCHLQDITHPSFDTGSLTRLELTINWVRVTDH